MVEEDPCIAVHARTRAIVIEQAHGHENDVLARSPGSIANCPSLTGPLPPGAPHAFFVCPELWNGLEPRKSCNQ